MSKIFYKMKREIKNIIKTFILSIIFSVSISIFIAYATPPTSPYLPGETLDPACSPGDPNCTVLPSLTGTSTPGNIGFYIGTTTLSGDTQLFWDNTNKRLGIGTSTPAGILHVATGTINALVVDNNGNVGIGTTTSSERLVVQGNALVTNNLFIKNQNAIIGKTDDDIFFQIRYWYSPTQFSDFLIGSYFQMNNGLVVPSIDNFGNLGIGTNNAPTIFIGNQNNTTSIASRVAIGTTTPAARLHVYESNLNRNGLLVNIYSTSSSYYSLNVQSGNISRLYVGGDGNVGIGTTAPEYKLDIQGTIRQTNALNCPLSSDANGAIICTVSSQRYKTNIKDLDFDINKFLALNPRSFDWNTSTINFVPGEKGSIGFIAEEVNEVFPELVRYKDGQPEGIKYELLPVYLFKIVKNLILGFTEKVKASLNELGIIIENGVAKIKEIFTEKITTKQICLEGDDGETICLDKNQVKELLNRSGGSYTTISNNQNSSNNNSTTTTNITENTSSQTINTSTSEENITSTSENNISNPQESVSNQNQSASENTTSTTTSSQTSTVNDNQSSSTDTTSSNESQP